MENKQTSINFLRADIQLACSTDELRPSLGYVFFKNGFAYATNANVLIKQSLKGVHNLSDEVIELLEGKALHYSSLNDLKKCEIFEFFPTHIEGWVKGSKSKIKAEFDTQVVMVNMEAVIPSTFADVDTCAFDPNVLAVLIKSAAFKSKVKHIKLHFSGVRRAMVVSFKGFDLTDQKGLLMPVTFN